MSEQDANTRQVGGNHYRASYQHWDMVADSGINYFVAAATKYAMRWRKKNGVQDVEKAIHFVEKLQQLHEQKRMAYPHAHSIWPLDNLREVNTISALEMDILHAALTYTNSEDLKRLRGLLEELLVQARNHELRQTGQSWLEQGR